MKRIYLIICIVFLGLSAYGTHNRAGEITYEQIGPLTIRMTLTTYTKESSASADRDSVEIYWGDGSFETIYRTNSGGESLPNDVKLNKYVKEHTYPGRSSYTISFTDPNRIGNILNVNYPNSIDIQFSLSTSFTLLDFQFQGSNSSAILLQPPLDFACVGKPFIHNPNAYDPDGDSLAYELVMPEEEPGIPVPGYEFPDEVLEGPDNIIFLDEITGDFLWTSPPQQGEYNIAIKIKEFRNGFLINTIIRDMQILVRACDNEPPTIETIEEICVVAGEKIELDVFVNDPDEGQLVELSASGGAFIVPTSPAELQSGSEYLEVPFTGKFVWQTNCDHISDQYYQVVFRAADNFFADTTGLATLKTIKIKVVGPPPENLEAQKSNGSVLLSWELPYQCEDIEASEFLGFSVWRKNTPMPIYIDTCNPGLEGSLYQRIAILTQESNGVEYFFEDNSIVADESYCYRVEAIFGKLTSSGNPYNIVESLPSNEFCVAVKRDLPLLTKVSVLETSVTAGSMEIRWQKPLKESFDEIVNPGPYQFDLLWSTDNINFEKIDEASVEGATFADITDTSFIHMNINTLGSQYFYKIDFFTGVNNILYGSSEVAASLRLSVNPSDNLNLLSLNEQVPWTNFYYEIFRRNDIGTFDLLARSRENIYSDSDLINGIEHCYFVRSYGSYGLPNIEDPIVNDSQEACATPEDNVPPCSPTLAVTNFCDNLDPNSSRDFINYLTWEDPNISCLEVQYIKSYKFYYKSPLEDNYRVIETKLENNSYTYNHNVENFGLAGCYYITALDSLGNESIPSNTVCVSNCPLYELPNTFTPNGDGANDILTPIKNFFISKIDIKIFNEWGNLVYESSDPEINWNGTSKNDKNVAQGTYYYTCRLYSLNSDGQEIEENPLLKGYINVLR